jgi:hypothetical protein
MEASLAHLVRLILAAGPVADQIEVAAIQWEVLVDQALSLLEK